MTIPEAARELGVATTTVHARIRTGAMHAEQVSARLWLVPQAEVERWKTLGLQKRGPKPRQRESG